MAGIAALWHRAQLRGIEHLPDGPALLVGNHGLFGFETPVFFYLLHRATGRYPVGLADRKVFGNAPMEQLIGRFGGVVGTRDNARALLRDSQLVVAYPGGSREVFKRRGARYQLQWDGALGFAKLAIAAGVPVVPFAGLGVDDTYVHLGHIGRLDPLMGRYNVPLALGFGPLPLPARLRFRLGAPIAPDCEPVALKCRVQAAVERMLDLAIEEEPEAEPVEGIGAEAPA